jgi:hypothetical protein
VYVHQLHTKAMMVGSKSVMNSSFFSGRLIAREQAGPTD